MRAVTRLLHQQVDLNDVAGSDGFLFVRNGVGFAGRGVSARVDATECEQLLVAIDHRNDTDLRVGPIALGSMPFDSASRTTLIVPRTVVGKDADGNSWITTISSERETDAVRDDVDIVSLLAAPPIPSVSTYEIRPLTPPSVYRDAVLTARDAVRRGDITKAVIARSVEVASSEPFDIHAVLLRLKATFSQSYRYSIDGFIGASPELLLSIDDDVVASHPLAGTAPRTGDPAMDRRAADHLLSSMKDQIEHRVVIDVIHDQLLPWCSYLDWEAEPSVVQVANVQHLGTRIEGRLNKSRPPLLDMVRQLCPTPALGGHPREDALRLIAAVEGCDRGAYGGAVGWVDAFGNGTWAVAIRCALLSEDRTRAQLFAGGGIVAESDPDAELAETQAKFQAMLSALIRA
ncbi:MAG: isochorismate synthase MenF [Actinomycetota bacterium]